MKKGKPTTVNQYIASSPAEGKAVLKKLYATIRKGAPKSSEVIKWGSPTFSYHRILVAFSAHTKHVNFMPTPSVIKAFSKELAPYKTGVASVQFPYDKVLPVALVLKMTKYRVKESVEKDVKWM